MLFQNGEDGFWYDPSDLSTMFQDAAGTIPVTGLGQPVGLLLDKSGNGYHLSQATSDPARPTLEARHNQLIATEEFDNPVWVATNMTVVGGATSPIGTSNAYTITATAANATLLQTANTTELARSSGIRVSFFVRRVTGTGNIQLTRDGVNYTTVTVTSDWDRVSISLQLQVGLRDFGLQIVSSGDAIEIWGAQVEADAGRNASLAKLTPYQRVTSASDYADVGHPRYLSFDGVDDELTITGLSPRLLFLKQRLTVFWAPVIYTIVNGSFFQARTSTTAIINIRTSSNTLLFSWGTATNSVIGFNEGTVSLSSSIRPYELTANVNAGTATAKRANRLFVLAYNLLSGYRTNLEDNLLIGGPAHRMYQFILHSAVGNNGTYEDVTADLDALMARVP
jgi:hypothetical protein